MRQTKAWLAAALAAIGVAAPPAQAQDGDSPFHWQPAADDARPRPWAIMLPGGGGLSVFHDTDHYYRWARWLNARGIDVLLVDHVALSEVPGPDGEIPGQMLARFAEQGLAMARREGRMDARCSGVVLGWSFGGAGMLEVAAAGRGEFAGLAGAAGFYPLVTTQPDGYLPRVPVLILQGNADDTTTPAQLDRFLAAAAGSQIDVVSFDHAHHTFDAEGLTEPVAWNGGTFLYNAPAARGAAEALDEWLGERGMTGGGGCALD